MTNLLVGEIERNALLLGFASIVSFDILKQDNFERYKNKFEATFMVLKNAKGANSKEEI
jgi:hypothetical protein